MRVKPCAHARKEDLSLVNRGTTELTFLLQPFPRLQPYVNKNNKAFSTLSHTNFNISQSTTFFSCTVVVCLFSKQCYCCVF